MTTVKDVIYNNDGNLIVKISGQNPNNDCDPLSPTYYHGKLADVPERYYDKEVLSIGWLLVAGCHSINIPFTD